MDLVGVKVFDACHAGEAGTRERLLMRRNALQGDLEDAEELQVSLKDFLALNVVKGGRKCLGEVQYS